MQIVLDSSAIVAGDWNLAHNDAQALLAAGARGEVELVMPQIVFDEVVAAYDEREERVRKSLEKSEEELRTMWGARATGTSGGSDWEADLGYERHLWKTISSGGRFLDYPVADHRLLVTRSLERRAPFDSTGRRGYRDALIWHNVLEVAQSGESIVLVTSDNDFRGDGAINGLHRDLVKDLEDHGIDPQRISLTRSLKEAVEAVLEPALDLIETLSARLESEPDWREQLANVLIDRALEEADSVDGMEVDVLLGREVEAFAGDITEELLEYVDNFRRLAIADAIPLREEQFGLEIWMDASAFYDVTLSTHRFHERPEQVPADLFLSGDERSAYVSGSADVRLIFELTYDKATKNISDPRLVRLGSVGEPPPAVLGRRKRTMSSRRKKSRRLNWFSLNSR